eukprot:TRINITY_DN1822_c0_g1_i1.p1 TRINITY_DN1822_c0_g1~~TRINITY_DN1822_c0_g1_i1.p1  ORF type:complete len:166 (+),score=14.00 TRINITY_DN1822_c0_g1_i1:53-550(+)
MKTVWLDCDPGHDDACAIMMAGHQCKLLGISTVMGNQTVEKTTQNALKVVEISGLSHIDVAKGCARPLIRDLAICPEIHGDSGLDSTHYKFPQVSKKPVNENAISFMYNKIKSSPEKVHLIATAALTNVALLLRVYPDVVDNIEQIVILGEFVLTRCVLKRQYNT